MKGNSAMDTLEQVITEHPLLKGLAPSFGALLVTCASNTRFETGQYLFRDGEPADAFYILRHGRVALETYVGDRGTLILQTMKDGDVLGWAALAPPYHWHVDARAVEPTRAIGFDAACVRNTCDAHPDLGYELMKRFARVLDDSLHAVRLQLLDVYGTVAR